MKKGNKRTNTSTPNPQSRIERRLEALIVLFAGLLSQGGAGSERAKEKVAVLLLRGGISQDSVALLLGIKRGKVTKASKNVKL